MRIELEYKIINKQLMATRTRSVYDPPRPPLGSWSSWQIRDNIFETVKAFLLWNYPSSWLPMFAPHFDHDHYPQLSAWYAALSKPNSPYRRVLKVSEDEHREWVRSLDLSKPYNEQECSKMFEIVAAIPVKREVDAVEIAENENREITNGK